MERYQHTWFWPTSVLYPALTASTVHSVHCPLAPWLGVRLVWQWPEPALDTEQDLLFGITALVGITDPSAPSCWSRCSLIYFWADGWGRWDGSTYAGRGASEYSSTGGVHQQELICWCESGLGAKSQASVDTWWEECYIGAIYQQERIYWFVWGLGAEQLQWSNVGRKLGLAAQRQPEETRAWPRPKLGEVCKMEPRSATEAPLLLHTCEERARAPPQPPPYVSRFMLLVPL